MVELAALKVEPAGDQTKLYNAAVGVAVTEPLLLQVGSTFVKVTVGIAFTVTGKLKVLGQRYLVIPPTIDLE
jgi:hypothetical protein